jgi:Ca-activated chloride channel family protein
VQRAMKLPPVDKNVSRTFVVVTDGYIAEETAMFEQVRKHLGEANVFAFGIGSAVNRFLIDGIAKAGQGEPFVVLDQSKAAEASAKFRAYVEQPVLTHVQVAFDGFDTYDVQPQVLPDVFANRPVVVFGKYRGTADGKASGKVTLTGVSGRGRFVSTLDASTVAPDAKNGALSYLWARAKISELSDFFQGDANKQQVVELGLKYNLLTKFTSFIAVQQVVRATANGSTDVDVPLPMPAGVSDNAVGMEVGAEPPLVVLIALVALGMSIAMVRTYRRRRLPAARRAA